MIEVTRLNGKKLTLNAELVEMIEETPDTVITLINGKKIVVMEKSQEVIDRVKRYKADICGRI